ncbi:MAG: immunoglobulin domain-containing protein, partial [Flavobacteriaceae bacterium]|nr:immunoglobulin domain-containing protein [Flavobacteriaceae bacterium]
MKQLFLYFLLFASTVYAQQETANWYFGRNAGIRFNPLNGTVTAVTDGKLRTLEGCSSISDRSGNLLFYTDGVTIFDKNHNIMQNGDNLSGDFSSTQSAIIVPKPNDLNIYYVFTVDEPHHLNIDNIPNNNDADDDQKNNGLNYSVVDMRLNNGNGAVVSGQKNIHLITYDINNPLEVAYKGSEKITAVRASDCESIWVITQFVDRFYSFKVDVNGVNSIPITTQIAPEVPVSGYRRNAIGYLKASPDGSKLAIAHLGLATVTAGNATGKVLLYDFDNTTGVVSNGVELYDNDSPYGIEFSPSGKKLYASVGLGIVGNLASKILQFDLESIDIAASQTVIWESDIFTSPAMQIGLDKKIYVSQLDFNNNSTGKYLNVIENPDALAASVNFIENAIFLDVGNQNRHLSQIGLPPFIQSFFANKIDIILNGKSTSNLSLCEGDNFTLKAVEIPGAVYTWTKDDVLLPQTGFTLDLVNVNIADAGIYRVSIDKQDGTCPIEGEASVQVISLSSTQNAVLNQCDDDSDGLSVFDLDLAKTDLSNGVTDLNIDFYLSLTDAQNQTNILQSNVFRNTSNSQTIFARLYAVSAGCSIIREVTLNVSSTTANDAVLEACDDDGNEDGFHAFNLSNADSQVRNGLPAGLSVRYYV